MDDAEARDILRAHDEPVTPRGKLSDAARLKAQHYADQDQGAGDYDQGTSPADFGPDGAVSETVAAEPPAVPAERPPRRVRATRTHKPLGARLGARLGAQDKGKPKRKQPRISTASMVSNAWAAVGGMVARADAPMGRCLVYQSDAAGDILDDLVRGTFFDPALQWAARAEQKGRKAAALFGPPVCVAIIERAQMLPEPQRKMREALAFPMLVNFLMLLDEVSADRAEERLERHKLDGPRREQAEKIAQLIFAMAEKPAAEPDRETVPV